MNIYHLLKSVTGKRLPVPLKIIGLWGMYITRRRVIGIFMDPVLACNLRCRMCYFSDKQYSPVSGRLSEKKLNSIDKALFHRALKLQIGCAAEPTLYPGLIGIIMRGRRAGIPYISLTTNGQLIASGQVNLMELVDAGLHEITLSMHGTCRETYEFLMPGASFEKLERLMMVLASVKSVRPHFKIRCNFTVNSLNVDDLSEEKFWRLWQSVQPDIIQLRPVQKIGDTAWTDFNLTPLREKYEQTIGSVIEECHRRGIVCLAPTQEQLGRVNKEQDGFLQAVEDLMYCYIDPNSCYDSDFDIESDTYETYHHRRKTGCRLLQMAFGGGLSSRTVTSTKKMNYTIT